MKQSESLSKCAPVAQQIDASFLLQSRQTGVRTLIPGSARCRGPVVDYGLEDGERHVAALQDEVVKFFDGKR